MGHRCRQQNKNVAIQAYGQGKPVRATARVVFGVGGGTRNGYAPCCSSVARTPQPMSHSHMQTVVLFELGPLEVGNNRTNASTLCEVVETT